MKSMKTIFSLSLLTAAFPLLALGGAAPLSQPLKALKSCQDVYPTGKVLGPMNHIGALDSHLHHWDTFLKGAETEVKKNKQSCGKFLQEAAKVNRLQKLHDSVKGARIPMKEDGGGHKLLGMGAVGAALRRLGAEGCLKEIQEKSNKAQAKEHELKTYCGR